MQISRLLELLHFATVYQIEGLRTAVLKPLLAACQSNPEIREAVENMTATHWSLLEPDTPVEQKRLLSTANRDLSEFIAELDVMPGNLEPKLHRLLQLHSFGGEWCRRHLGKAAEKLVKEARRRALHFSADGAIENALQLDDEIAQRKALKKIYFDTLSPRAAQLLGHDPLMDFLHPLTTLASPSRYSLSPQASARSAEGEYVAHSNSANPFATPGTQ
eukprot:TRINITY_DN81764_c0_g1_i1.p1 TRINITY_DN81764_c0_g1~~TRINITY_DN81764_c0_g1_i1.p1  ORF type:complete len:237 (+),score=47.05 TRINITY_DN81764_c0_g1_i1:59-712(+)